MGNLNADELNRLGELAMMAVQLGAMVPDLLKKIGAIFHSGETLAQLETDERAIAIDDQLRAAAARVAAGLPPAAFVPVS